MDRSNLNVMKKTIKNFVVSMIETDKGLTGGFGFIRGGRRQNLPGANGVECTNDGICTSTNSRDCNNTGHCSGTSNTTGCSNTTCIS